MYEHNDNNLMGEYLSGSSDESGHNTRKAYKKDLHRKSLTPASITK